MIKDVKNIKGLAKDVKDVIGLAKMLKMQQDWQRVIKNVICYRNGKRC